MLLALVILELPRPLSMLNCLVSSSLLRLGKRLFLLMKLMSSWSKEAYTTWRGTQWLLSTCVVSATCSAFCSKTELWNADLEYYPGILMMTTNRVKTFDEAFLSRIHIALHFHTLPSEALKQVWVAFLLKTGVTIGDVGTITDAQVTALSERPINGRQVKNAVRTASSLALSRKEQLRYEHVLEVLDVMDQFTAEFKASNLEV